MAQDLRRESFQPKYCVHTKNIFSLLDLPTKDETHKTLMKHLEVCPVCAQEFKNFQLGATAAQVYIPKVVMDRELKESFEREVGDLFKILRLDEREVLKHNVKKSFRTLDQMGIDFLKVLASKSMIKVYVVASILFFILKYFF